MNFEAVLHYKHQNQGRDEKKKKRHVSGTSANSEASNSDSEVDSTEHSPVPSPGQKKANEVSAAAILDSPSPYSSTNANQPFRYSLPDKFQTNLTDLCFKCCINHKFMSMGECLS